MNSWLDQNPDLEMRLLVAHKSGQLLRYLEGDDFTNETDAVNHWADFLFVLFLRPLFDETLRLAKMLSG